MYSASENSEFIAQIVDFMTGARNDDATTGVPMSISEPATYNPPNQTVPHYCLIFDRREFLVDVGTECRLSLYPCRGSMFRSFSLSHPTRLTHPNIVIRRQCKPRNTLSVNRYNGPNPSVGDYLNRAPAAHMSQRMFSDLNIFYWNVPAFLSQHERSSCKADVPLDAVPRLVRVQRAHPDHVVPNPF